MGGPLDALEGATVAVTGGRGYIGAAVVEVLREAGAAVRVFTGDLLTESPRAWISGATHVVHLAARSGGLGFQESEHQRVLHDNTLMTRRVLDACVRAKVDRVFLASSGVVYSADAGEVLTETDRTVVPGCENVTGYAWSKLTDEAVMGWYGQEHGLQIVAGRFTNVYGPNGPFEKRGETVIHALIRKCVAAAPDGEVEVWGDGTAVRNFIYVDDAARGVCAALAVGEPGQAYNIAASDGYAIGDLARMIVAETAPDLTLAFDPTKPTGPAKRVLASEKLRGLGWEPEVDVADGLARTIAWWRGQG